jgi:osmotically-inducible protein OsmY
MRIKSGLAACIGVAATMTFMSVHADPSQDKAITDQVKMAFAKNPDVGTEIGVMTKNGVVYLTGSTTTPLAKSHAESIAKAVPGVTQVVDDVGTQK